MNIQHGHGLDFKDVLIRPKRSTVNSRADVDINRTFQFPHSTQRWVGFPVIASNMDTIGTLSMARALAPFHSIVALHKHYPADKLIEFFNGDNNANAFYTCGITQADTEKMEYVKMQAHIPRISIDVANGYINNFSNAISKMRDQNRDAVIMAGTIATPEMAEALIVAGADIVRVGIGSGSVCITRDITGVGYPQLTAVIESADAAHRLKGHVCSDGGCSVPGDIAKAFGAGADFVMLGSMLAGHQECEADIRYEDRGGEKIPVSMEFYGMSSERAMNKYHSGVSGYRAPEGIAIEVPYKGPVEQTIRTIIGGIRSMMTYIGATRLCEIPQRTTFVVIYSRRPTAP
jgi:GMP reductase